MMEQEYFPKHKATYSTVKYARLRSFSFASKLVILETNVLWFIASVFDFGRMD